MYETITTNIMVKNVKETVRFYEGKLGFTKVLIFLHKILLSLLHF